MNPTPKRNALVISLKSGHTQIPDKVVLYLAKILRRPEDVVRTALLTRTIRISKIANDENTRKFIAFLEQNNLTTYWGRSESAGDKTMRNIFEPETHKPETWRQGDVLEGIYEVFGSAEGGMGRVYFVFHKLWRMKLAIKTPLKAALTKESHILRFLREAELWVNLGLHPNIATCYYARVIDGLPRLFIEYVDGGPLDQWHDKGLLRDLPKLMDLMLQFCHGMIYAEGLGLVHRDIKPANCLLTRDGVLKITDFGLVKRMEDPGIGIDDETRSDDTTSRRVDFEITSAEAGIMGSPKYIAPERFRSTGEDIRSDIYSFGVMLYELILNRMPFDLPKTYALRDLIRSHLRAQPVDPLFVRPEIPKSLSRLMLTCVEKKKENRFPTFSDLCAELEQIATELRPGKRIRPRPNLMALKTDSLNNQAVSLLDLGREDEARTLLEDACSANPEHLEAVYNLHIHRWTKGEISDHEVVGSMESLRIETRVTADYAFLMGLIALQRGDASGAIEYLRDASSQDAKYAGQWERYGGDPGKFVASLKLRSAGTRKGFAGHIKKVHAISFGGAGCRTVGEDRLVRVWDVETARVLKHFRISNFPIECARFSLDGETLALGFGSAYKALELWSVTQGRLIHRHPGVSVTRVACSPDGRFVGFADLEGALRILDRQTNRVVCEIPGVGGVTALAFLGRGSILAVGTESGSLAMYDVKSGSENVRLALHEGPISVIQAAHDDKLFLTGGTDQRIHVLETSTGKSAAVFSGAAGRVTGIVSLPDARNLISITDDGVMKMWGLESRRCFRTITTQNERFSCCAYSDEAKLLVTGSARGTVAAWTVETAWFDRNFPTPAIAKPKTFKELMGLHLQFRQAVAEFNTLWKKGRTYEAFEQFEKIRSATGFSWSKEAAMVRNLLGEFDPQARLRSAAFIRSFQGHSDDVVSVRPSTDGLKLMSAGLDGLAVVWDITSGKRLLTIKVGSPIHCAFFVRRDSAYLTWSMDHVGRLWDEKAALLQEFPAVDPPLSLSHTGKEFFALGPDKRALKIVLTTGEREPLGPTFGGSHFACFSHDHKTIYSMKDAYKIQRWSTHHGRILTAFRDPPHTITSLCPNHADDKVVVGLENGEMMLYVVGSGLNVANLRGHSAAVRNLAVRATGGLWLSGSDDQTLRLWNMDAQECLAILEGHTAPVRSVCFFGNMFMAASGCTDGSVRLWGFEWELLQSRSSGAPF